MRLLALGIALAGCGVAQSGVHAGASSPTSFADLNLSARPCAIQINGLLTAADLPPHLTPEYPASSVVGTIGPSYDLGGGGAVYPGSLGDANASFQWTGFTSHPVVDVPSSGAMYTTHPIQVFQLAEEIDDWGTIGNAKRWMTGARLNPGDVAPAMGDDTFMFHVDEGEPMGSAPYTDAHPGDVFTDLEVRVGSMMFALSLDSGPDANPATLVVSIMRRLMAREHAVCG